MMPTGWVFRLEIVSDKTPYTKEIVEEIGKLLDESEKISHYVLEEIPSAVVKLFEKEEAKPA